MTSSSNSIAEKSSGIGNTHPFVDAFAEYIVQIESARGEVNPDGIRQQMFGLYDYFFEYEWRQIWLIIQRYKKEQAKSIFGGRSGLVISSNKITGSFVRQSMSMQPSSFYLSKRFKSGTNGGASLDEFRDRLITQALRTLGLDTGSSFKAAKNAYRNLMNENHPDKFNQDPVIWKQKGELCANYNAAWNFVKDFLPQ